MIVQRYYCGLGRVEFPSEGNLPRRVSDHVYAQHVLPVMHERPSLNYSNAIQLEPKSRGRETIHSWCHTDIRLLICLMRPRIDNRCVFPNISKHGAQVCRDTFFLLTTDISCSTVAAFFRLDKDVISSAGPHPSASQSKGLHVDS